MATTKTSEVTPIEAEPRVLITIPFGPEDDAGIKRDPYEHVTINGTTTLIRRGEPVEVTVPVFIQLRNKYKTL